MRGILGFFSGIIVLICFSSCQKEINWSANSTNILGDSVFIQKIVWVDSTLPVGLDTVYYNFYEYDAQKRIKRITVTEYDVFGSRFVDFYNFSYTGQDTLPYRYSTTQLGSTDSIISYLSYSNGFVIKDSSRYYINNILDEILWYRFKEVSPGKFEYTLSDESASNPGVITTDDSVRYTRVTNNGNILSFVDSIWSGGGFSSKASGQMTYDNAKSPFSKQALWCLGYYGKQLDFSKLEGSNNLSSITVNYLFGPPETDNYTYDYNTKNYPVTGRVSATTPPDFNKLIFVYITL